MRIKSSNKIKVNSILSAQNVKCKVTKGRQILSGHPNLAYATTLLVCKRKASLYLGYASTGAEQREVFKARKAAWHLSVQINGVPFLVRSVRGAAIVANWGINRL